jgi:hypothetical protein
MNTRLEELFNLAPVKTGAAEKPVKSTEEMLEVMKITQADIDKIDAALPQVVGLDASEREMDELADMATEGYKNLMELGMNVETRHAAEIFGAASSLLGHALTAKRNKIEKKLKVLELQLKKQRLDQQIARTETTEAAQIQGSATVIDRNALIAEILNKNKANPA